MELGERTAFLYFAGETRDIQVDEKTWRQERIGVLAENGWGTYFDPARDSTYRMTVRVLEPDPDASHFSAIVLLRGSNYVNL